MKKVKDLLAFLENSPTAVHAASEAVARLKKAGFKQLDERNEWDLKPGDKFFVVRRHSSVIAGEIGTKPPAQSGLRIAGAHTDVPGLRLKPKADYSREGYLQFGVEVYGGPILATWLDRDLTLAGRLVVSDGKKKMREVPVRLTRPVCRIPNLAVHLNRGVNDDGLKVDKQKHLPPIIGLGEPEDLKKMILLGELAEAAGVKKEDIAGFRLDLVDAQPPAIGGRESEFIFARGIDNLVSTYAAVVALIDCKKPSESTRLIALYDNEESGSNTDRGAASPFLDDVIERLCMTGKKPRENFQRAIARSLLVSADGAHAVHPNYADKHDPKHKPRLNGGPVIKINANERYATTIATQVYLERCGEAAGIPMQHFAMRSDLPCGSTIGPISATRLGMATVDVGAPMLSMHSIRETTGVNDTHHLTELLKAHLLGDVVIVE